MKPCEILLLRDGSLHAGVGSHPSAHTFLLLRIVISEQVKHLQGLHKEPSELGGENKPPLLFGIRAREKGSVVLS